MEHTYIYRFPFHHIYQIVHPLMALFGFATKQALLNGKLTGFAKGGIFENYVADALIKRGYTLHYYKPDDYTELEFIVEKGGEVVPIEVKAGNSATKSLNTFADTYAPVIAYKLIGGNIGRAGVKYTIPHYLAMFI